MEKSETGGRGGTRRNYSFQTKAPASNQEDKKKSASKSSVNIGSSFASVSPNYNTFFDPVFGSGSVLKSLANFAVNTPPAGTKGKPNEKQEKRGGEEEEGDEDDQPCYQPEDTAIWILFNVTTGCSNICDFFAALSSKSNITHCSLYVPKSRKLYAVNIVQNMHPTEIEIDSILNPENPRNQIIFEYVFDDKKDFDSFVKGLWIDSESSYDYLFMYMTCIFGRSCRCLLGDWCFNGDKITCSRFVYSHLKRARILPPFDRELSILPSELYELILESMDKYPDTFQLVYSSVDEHKAFSVSGTATDETPGED